MNRATPLVAAALAVLAACGEADREAPETRAPASSVTRETAPQAVPQQAAATLIAPGAVTNLVESHPGLLVLDVRTPEEFAEERLEGAVNLPVDELEQAIAEGRFDQPQERPILVYCRSGGRSARAASILAERGYGDVFDLEGGISGWREADLPVVR